MGCTKRGHSHVWPTAGKLFIQRCEVRCNFCNGLRSRKDWKYAWFLRRHVRAVHVKESRKSRNGGGAFPNVDVSEEWDEQKATRGNSHVNPPPESMEWVRQPVYFEQQRVSETGTYEPIATLADRIIKGAEMSNIGVDPHDKSNNEMILGNEGPSFYDSDRAPGIAEIAGYLHYLVGGDADITDAVEAAEPSDMHSLFGSEPSDAGIPSDIEPVDANTLAPLDDSEMNTADDSITVGHAHGPVKHTFERSDRDTAMAKFFMGPDEEDLDDMPMPQTFEERFKGIPSIDEVWPTFGDVNKTTEQLEEQGFDMAGMQHMLPALAVFGRSLRGDP